VEDLEDDHGAVHHLAAHFDFQVACLRGRNLMVHQDRIDLAAPGQRIVLPIDVGLDLLALAHAQVGVGVEAGALLDEGVNHLQPQGLGEFPKFGQ
jgi:hypothetical protein